MAADHPPPDPPHAAPDPPSASAAADSSSLPPESSRRRLSLHWMAWGVLVGSLLGVSMIVYLGTRPAPPVPEEKKKAPRPPFELLRLATLPNSVDAVEATVKPGHWTAAQLDAVANDQDLAGALQTNPLPLPEVPFAYHTARPALLPKKQRKQLELSLFIPPDLTDLPLEVSLRTGPGGRELERGAFPLAGLPAFQFYLVVLTRDPDRYPFLERLDAMVPPGGELFDPTLRAHYRVLRPRVTDRTPVAGSALAWTHTAYLWWDDFDPGLLRADQQQALLDWLHWGGQLIVSGPGSLDTLRGSFFDRYLPAQATGSRPLSADDLATLAQAVQTVLPAEAHLSIEKPWEGVQLAPADDAVALVTGAAGPLVVERRLGRGRAVVTAFRLTERELVHWGGFDNWVNALLLRRPARQFHLGAAGAPVAQWSTVLSGPANLYNTRRLSQLRFFARDFDPHLGLDGIATDPPLPPAVPAPVLPPMLAPRVPPGAALPPIPSVSGPIEPAPAAVGPAVAEWRDTGPVFDALRAALRRASGIDIPKRQFVLRVLGAYLAVLVPLNWLVFRLLGRVEWAWFAVPVFAVAGAMAVTRMAQLNIGFARAQTELSVMELQPDYSRAHVLRGVSLYTSLATTYEVESADPGGCLLPLATGAPLLAGQSRDNLEFRRGTTAQLAGLRVPSNALGLVRCEEFLDTGGGLVLSPDGQYLRNATPWSLDGAHVVGPQGLAWIGALAPDAEVALSFAPLERSAWHAYVAGQLAAARLSTLELHLAPLAALARDHLPADAVRLIAWSTAGPPGLKISPSAPQVRRAQLVLAHLRYPDWPAPTFDVNAHASLEPSSRPAAP